MVATEALDMFLGTAYARGRHQRRIDEISAYEAGSTEKSNRPRPGSPQPAREPASVTQPTSRPVHQPAVP
jgi:hypothetical protein